MGLSSELISQFVKITNDSKEKPRETTVYGTVKSSNDRFFVQLDGSGLLTPVIATTSMKDGDRVTVLIKNHSAIVTGNLTSPSASSDALKDLSEDLGIVGDELQGVVSDFDLLVKSVSEINDDLVETGQQVVSNRNEINVLKAKTPIEAMTVGFSGHDIEINTAGGINLAELRCNSSNGKLIHDGIGIVVGAGVKKVLISAQVFIRNEADMYSWYGIYHSNSAGTLKNRWDSISNETKSYTSLSFSDILVDVAQGDKFVLTKMEANKHYIRNVGTYMTAKVAL